MEARVIRYTIENTVKTKLSLVAIGIGIVLILLGILESNLLSSDAQQFFPSSTTETAFWLLGGGIVVLAAGVLAFAWAVTE